MMTFVNGPNSAASQGPLGPRPNPMRSFCAQTLPISGHHTPNRTVAMIEVH